MSDPFISEVKLFGGNFAPRNWALCQGQLLAIASNTALFSLLGTTYGGDGRTTFALPDLRGRAIVHPGQGPGLTNRLQGQKSGAETDTLSTSQLPSHTHPVASSLADMDAHTANADQFVPSSARAVAAPTIQNNPGLTIFSTNAADTDIEGGATSGSLDLQNAGGGQSHTNMMPFHALNYIIALVGVFPSRN